MSTLHVTVNSFKNTFDENISNQIQRQKNPARPQRGRPTPFLFSSKKKPYEVRWDLGGERP